MDELRQAVRGGQIAACVDPEPLRTARNDFDPVVPTRRLHGSFEHFDEIVELERPREQSKGMSADRLDHILGGGLVCQDDHARVRANDADFMQQHEVIFRRSPFARDNHVEGPRLHQGERGGVVLGMLHTPARMIENFGKRLIDGVGRVDQQHGFLSNGLNGGGVIGHPCFGFTHRHSSRCQGAEGCSKNWDVTFPAGLLDHFHHRTAATRG
jgi:hypothetical protein